MSRRADVWRCHPDLAPKGRRWIAQLWDAQFLEENPTLAIEYDPTYQSAHFPTHDEALAWAIRAVGLGRTPRTATVTTAAPTKSARGGRCAGCGAEL